MSMIRIAAHTPMLWLIGGVVAVAMGCLTHILAIGHLTRILTTSAPAGGALHDTYYVVDHLHYTLSLAVVFAFFAACYYLFPKLTGYAYSDLLGRMHFGLLSVGVILMLVPQIFLLPLMVRQPPDVVDLARHWNLMARVGSYISAASTVVFFANMVLSFLRRRPAHGGFRSR